MCTWHGEGCVAQEGFRREGCRVSLRLLERRHLENIKDCSHERYHHLVVSSVDCSRACVEKKM